MTDPMKFAVDAKLRAKNESDRGAPSKSWLNVPSRGAAAWRKR